MSSVVLDPRSIVDSLACLQIDINVDDIMHPTPDRVQTIYYAFCNQILEIPEKSLCELPFECIVNSETSEMQQRSNSHILLLTTMKCFIVDFADPSYDFSICDLINPLPKKTRRFLSVMADFVNFYQKASQVFEKTSGEFDDARKVIEAGQEQVRLAEEEKSALVNGYDLMRRKELELLGEKNAKDSKLKELIKKGINIEDRRNAILESISNKKQQIINLNKEFVSLGDEIVHISKGIVESPVQLVKDVEDQRELVKNLQNVCDTERQRIHDNAESITVVEQISKLVNERFNDIDRLRDLQKGNSRHEQILADSKSSLDELMKHKTHTEEILSRFNMSSNEETKAHERARELYASRLQDLEQRRDTLKCVVKDLRENAPSFRDEILQLKNEIVTLHNDKYHRAEADFESYSKMLSESLHSISSALDDAECMTKVM
ncbi:hypothetical protein DICVIV_02461 [Dictyocaulus viviparus]|uniref:Kinetochore protein Nuf2 N-terminal domain-containing protein n=1 Tax=Dictyocaulus viviparus TaxID=29172 RepID=A0A0D8Y582_DICVI|nr:hypothetical protein DICVIV_02461 [Dictyocaulus viviparus]